MNWYLKGIAPEGFPLMTLDPEEAMRFDSSIKKRKNAPGLIYNALSRDVEFTLVTKVIVTVE
jgi:hypothetical protein